MVLVSEMRPLCREDRPGRTRLLQSVARRHVCLVRASFSWQVIFGVEAHARWLDRLQDDDRCRMRFRFCIAPVTCEEAIWLCSRVKKSLNIQEGLLVKPNERPSRRIQRACRIDDGRVARLVSSCGRLSNWQVWQDDRVLVLDQ